MMTRKLCGLKIGQEGGSNRRGRQQQLVERSSRGIHLWMLLLVSSVFVGLTQQAIQQERMGFGHTAVSRGASPVGVSTTGKLHVPSGVIRSSAQTVSQQASKVKFDSDLSSSNCVTVNKSQRPPLIVDNYFEYEENDGIPGIKVAGRLLQHADFWKSISAPQFILDTVLHGYVLPFVEKPPSMCSKNNKSAINHSSFVTKAISELLELGTVELCKT